jgi:glycosyltransferase involved in cell wall biosynthesis
MSEPLVMVTHNYPEGESQAGSFLVDYVESLDRPVRVLHFPFGEFPLYRLIKNPLKWPKFIAYFIRVYFALKRELRRDTEVVAHWWIPIGFMCVSFSDRVHIVSHGTDLYWLSDHPSVARLLATRAQRVHKWQCVSRFLQGKLRALYGIEGFVEPMPISKVFRRIPDVARDGRLVVAAGRYVGRKSFDVLIKATHSIPDARLELYGEGPDGPGLQQLVDSLGAGDRITIAQQFIPKAELARVFNRASLFVSLAEGQGYGLVLKEALACGCPTMAYPGDGQEDAGITYELNRSDDIAERINAALTAPNPLDPSE